MFETILARLAVGCGLYQPTIALLTAVTAFVLALVILYLYKSVLPEERWLKYFGGFFAILVLQYLPQAADRVAALLSIPASVTAWIVKIPISFGSAANNLLILATGLALLFPDTQKHPRRLEDTLGRGRLPREASLFTVDRRDFPSWSIPLAVLTFLISLLADSFYARLPIALVSAACLTFLGIALFINFGGSHKRRPLALLNLVGSLVYAGVQISYAINPLLADGKIFPSFARRLGQELAGFAGSRELAQVVTHVTKLSALDSLVFGTAFLLKISLFLGALLLIIRLLLVLSPQDQRQLLEDITTRRGTYLDAQGVLKALGETVGADLVSLNVRRPETHKVRVELMSWLREPQPGIPERIDRDLLPAEESIVSWVMMDGLEQVSCPNVAKAEEEVRRRYFSYVPGMRSFVTLPIVYQGAIIACLNLEWRGLYGYSATTVQRIRQMAELLAPTIFAYRQLVALDILAEKLRYLKPDPEPAMDAPPLAKLAAIVHDALSPLATGLALGIGFRRPWTSCNDSLALSGDAFQEQSLHSLVLRPPGQEPAEILREKLIVHGVGIGELSLAVDRDRDPLTRPSLAADPLHRQAVASLLADAILDDMEERLTRVLNRLQGKLNAISDTEVETWFKYVQNAARKVGFLWAVARTNEQDGLIGGLEERAIVEGLQPTPSAPETEEGRGIRCLNLALPVGATQSVLALPLPTTGGRLWLGFRWDDLAEELSFLSPWKTFLLGFGQAADLALHRLERHRQLLEAKQFEHVTMRVETAGLVMHTLGNDAVELLHGTERLEEILPEVGSPMTVEIQEKIHGLRKSAQSFTRLAATFKTRVPADDRQRVALLEAIDPIQTNYGEMFRDRSIELIAEMTPEVIVGTPIDIAYVALVTLIVNACDSIRRHGRILISTEEKDGRILCHVEDDGPGITEDLIDKIFRIRFSTKSNGTGIGLPLAKNSMLRYGGDLRLTHTRPGSTIFTISFPK